MKNEMEKHSSGPRVCNSYLGALAHMNEGFLGLVDLYTCGGAAMLSRGLPGGSQHSEGLPMLKEDFEDYPL